MRDQDKKRGRTDLDTGKSVRPLFLPLFHPDDGETFDIKAGDTVYFDENSKGTWEVLETVRKAYLTFKRN